MDHMLAKKLDVFATIYCDNILVCSHNEQDQAEHLRWVLEKLCKYQLKANRKKSTFGLNELQYFGHIIKRNTFSIEL